MSSILRDMLFLSVVLAFVFAVPGTWAAGRSDAIGEFAGHADVGTVLHAGSVAYDAGTKRYTVSGSGENMWASQDAFQFAWKKVSGRAVISADIAFVGAGKEPHRKAVLMMRQSLDSDSPYVDAAVHGDGLTSLQFRESKGAATHEVQANVIAPKRVRLEWDGKYARLWLGDKKGWHFSGAAQPIELTGPFYIGIGVCSHNKDVVEQAVFNDVHIGEPAVASGEQKLYSTLETQALASTDRRVCFVTPTHIEAPNWMPDGSALIYNSGGRLYRIPVTGGTPEVINTGFAVKCNNDHGISPDGKLLVISDQSREQGQSLIYTLPIGGGTPKRITPVGPSYWHGWSPDGRTLAYCAQRNGQFDIYTIPAAGGAETRLTDAPGLDDGPEYSPDGRHIYFNSERTGRMQIWRMKADGSDQTQITRDEHNNWFPHPSPDGRRMVFLTYAADVQGHPPNKDVQIRIMDLTNSRIDVLARLFGGQGTMNVPNWSPDGKRIAFVTYQLIP